LAGAAAHANDREALMLEVAILIGLPASGKTSFFHARLSATHQHVSKDLMPNVRDRSARQAQLIEKALAAGQSVAVDNVNVSAADRAAIIAIARRFGARTVGYVFEATTREAVGRNRGRPQGVRVPDVAIFVAAKRYAAPAREEGFDELWRVRTPTPGEFDVVPMEPRAPRG
jgi:predicted kinase